MATFPQLSFACPIDWNSMQGDERERFCAKCARTVVNLSTLTEEQRSALLATAKPGELCVAYYRRLTGEFVSAEKPLTDPERRGARQYGVASLTAAAMILSASGISQSPHAVTQAGLAALVAYEGAREEFVELRDKVVAHITGTPAPIPPTSPACGVVMFAGVMASPIPAPISPVPLDIPAAEAPDPDGTAPLAEHASGSRVRT